MARHLSPARAEPDILGSSCPLPGLRPSTQGSTPVWENGLTRPDSGGDNRSVLGVASGSGAVRFHGRAARGRVWEEGQRRVASRDRSLMGP